MQRHGQRSHEQHEHGHEHGHSHVAEDMLSVEEAYERIMASFGPLEAEERPLLETLGQVLTANITSPLDLPPMTNSAMDGYAVRGEDIRGASPDSPRELPVIGLMPPARSLLRPWIPEQPYES